MSPKLCGPKRGSKSLRKRASREINHDEKASEECKRPRLISTDDTNRNTKQLEKMETEKSSTAEEKQTIDGSSSPEVVFPQNQVNEVVDIKVAVESKVIPSFGKKSGTRNKTTKIRDQNELSPTRKSQLEEQVVETERNTFMCDSTVSGFSPEQFEDIVTSYVHKILDLASKTTSDGCEDTLSMISKETSRLLKDSRNGTFEEIPDQSNVDAYRGEQSTGDTEQSNVIAEHSMKSEANLSQSGMLEGDSELKLNKVDVEEKVDPKLDDVTVESKGDLSASKKEDGDSNGSGYFVEAEGNIPSEGQDHLCASSTLTNKTKSLAQKESALQQSQQDVHHQTDDFLVDHETASSVEAHLVTCKSSYDETEVTERNSGKKQNLPGPSKGSDELHKTGDIIVSADVKNLPDSDKPRESLAFSVLEEKSNEGGLPVCADFLDFTSSQLLQIEEVETEMIQQKRNSPPSKVEETKQFMQRVQEEDVDGIASRRREEERRDDRRVKEIMQKMMKDLNEIKLVTGSLLSQMTQYRKHRSQRQPQPSRLTGTQATTSGFYRSKLGKGSGSSQFKKL